MLWLSQKCRQNKTGRVAREFKDNESTMLLSVLWWPQSDELWLCVCLGCLLTPAFPNLGVTSRRLSAVIPLIRAFCKQSLYYKCINRGNTNDACWMSHCIYIIYMLSLTKHVHKDGIEIAFKRIWRPNNPQINIWGEVVVWVYYWVFTDRKTV